jgi:hypothetical protein
MAPKAKRVSVEDIDLVGIWGSSRGGRRKPLTKSSRRQELQREVVHLRHLPSGREIQIEIPFGHYSKREMQRLREEAKRKFVAILERKSATGHTSSATAGGTALRVVTNKGSTEKVALRITVVDPPPNISWALQLGRNQLAQPTVSTAARISFDFSVDVVEGESPGAFRLRGAAVQGRPGERFVYLCIGSYAGQLDAPAGGRAKVSLEGITRRLLDIVKGRRSGVLEAQFAGTGRDGGPSRASVKLLGDGWRVV